MKHISQEISEGFVAAADLADFLLARGIPAVSTAECARLMSVPENQVRQRLAAQRRNGAFVSPARGLWVPVPSEYRLWGAPEPMAYIDAMMAHLGVEYCVGWLSAAALHGASHHAPQVFQVAVSKTVADRTVGRSDLQFYERLDVSEYSSKTMTVPSGRAVVASVATTMLMVASDIALAGGIDNVANVIVELAEDRTIDTASLVSEASLFPFSAARRLGWLLEEYAGYSKLDELASYCTQEKSTSFLTPQAPRTGRFVGRWNLQINREVDVDV